MKYIVEAQETHHSNILKSSGFTQTCGVHAARVLLSLYLKKTNQKLDILILRQFFSIKLLLKC